MGTPHFSVPILHTLVKSNYEVVAVVTQPDRPVGRRRKLTPPPVKEAALQHHIDVIQPEKVSEKKYVAQILSYNPDIIVTAAFGQILPKQLLETPPFGCINVHASLLPKYRGGAPIHKAIIDGEKETGITIMNMVEQLDAGDILSQVTIPIKEDDHVGILHDKLSEAGASLLLDTLKLLKKNRITPVAQNEKEVSFAWNITREDEKLDWSKGGNELYNQIRGLNPWPVAFTTLEGKPLKVWWATKEPSKENHYKPGTVERIDTDGIVVATGDDISLKITELQPAGRRRMSSTAFLRGAGAHLEKGIRLGEDE